MEEQRAVGGTMSNILQIQKFGVGIDRQSKIDHFLPILSEDPNSRSYQPLMSWRVGAVGRSSHVSFVRKYLDSKVPAERN